MDTHQYTNNVAMTNKVLIDGGMHLCRCNKSLLSTTIFSIADGIVLCGAFRICRAAIEKS